MKQEAADESLERLDGLVAETAHGMRNPLSAIVASLELLKGDDCERPVEIIARSVRRIEQLLGALQDIVSIERGTFVVQQDDQVVAPLVERAAFAVKALAQRRGVLVQLEGDVEARAWCDGRRVGALVESLVRNGVQHTPADGVVTVRWAQQGSRLCLVVADTGSGITAERLRGVLTRRPEPSYERLGIDLFLAQAIARAHGAELEVKSPPGEGASFAFSLPIHTAMAQVALTPDGLDH